MTDFILRVLAAVARADAYDTIWWRADGEYAPVTFFANCSDTFAWATADNERITADTIDAFETAVDDVMKVTGGDGTYGATLYAARRRHERPMGRAYPSDTRLWPLFDAAGPERPGERRTDLTDEPTDHPVFNLAMLDAEDKVPPVEDEKTGTGLE